MAATDPVEQVASPEHEMGTVREVADYLRLSPAKVYGMLLKGELPFVKIGKARRIRWDRVRELVRRLETQARPASEPHSGSHEDNQE